jgi:acyl carrier protein
MTEQEILEVFNRILRDLLADDTIVLTMETTREDVDGWDSFNYVNFIVVAEMELGIKFGVSQVESFENVGAIVQQTKELLA